MLLENLVVANVWVTLDDITMASTLIKNGTCVLPQGTKKADVLLENGSITVIGALSNVNAEKTIDATGLHVLPGLIDSQVHFREPGLEHKEDLDSGTRAAALGGITAICEMPNTKPATTTAEAMADKVARAAEKAHVNYAFFIGAAAENVEQMPMLERLPGVVGVKIFMGSSTGSLLVADDETLERVLSHGYRRVAVHCEDEPRLLERKHLAVDHPRNHPVWRDNESAILATRRLLKAAQKTGRAVHALHITTAAEIDLLAKHKNVATVEVTPQHLTLTTEAYEHLGSHAQMNPPIRSAEEQAGLWRGIESGVVDVIGSDHAPHTLEEKSADYPNSPAGMPGVQTLLPLMLNHMNNGKLTLERLVDLLAAGPARLFNMRAKGRLVVGYDADLTIVDLKKQHTIIAKEGGSKCGWTPFEGMECIGWPVMTIIGGDVIMQDGELVKERQGRALRFWDVG